MGQKYLPTIRDQKAAQRFQQQQRRRVLPASPAKPGAAAPKGAAKTEPGAPRGKD